MESAKEYKRRVFKAFGNIYLTKRGDSDETHYGDYDVQSVIDDLYINGDISGEIERDIEMVVNQLDAKLEN